MKTCLWCLPIALVLTQGCGKEEPAALTGPGAGQEGARGSKKDRAEVVARVGQTDITVGRVEDEINKLHPSVRVRFSSPERRKEFVKNLVRLEVLAREARRRELDKDPEVIRRVKRAMIDVMMQQVRSSLVKMDQITDQDVADYYQKNIDTYRQPPKIRVSAIFTPTRAAATQLLSRARKKRGNVKYFGDLAAEHSVDAASKARRGDLGLITKKEDGRLAAPVLEAAFSIQGVWSYGGPVATKKDCPANPPEGSDCRWVILLKTGELAATNRPLEMERNRIRNLLFNERRRQAMDSFVDRLQRSADIEILDQNLSKVKLKDAPRPPASLMPPP